MGLHDFLTDRLTEDEDAARRDGADAMVGHRWKHAPEHIYDELQSTVLAASRRTVAEVASKRAILDLHRDLGADFYNPDHPDADADGVVRPNGTHECASCHHEEWPCPTVRYLATVYADHPDYSAEWAPQQ